MVEREDVAMDDEAFNLHSRICRRFYKAVMNAAFDQAVEDGCLVITKNRMEAAARCMAESRPTYLEDK